MAKPHQSSSEQHRLEGCCVRSAANLSMRCFVPLVHVQDSLKAPNVKGLELSRIKG